jgi:hypothetical protein
MYTALIFSAAMLGVWLSCGSLSANEPASSWSDPLYTQPYVDIDEWRDKPVRHRYVHGGFKGTEARFSIYFPPKEQYQGRFFQRKGDFKTRFARVQNIGGVRVVVK